MAAILGLGQHQARKENPPDTALRIQTSIIGKPIPIIYGQCRVSVNLLDYTDFASQSHFTRSQGGKGSVGGGGGKGSSGTTSYTYSAAVDMGICEGPIASVDACWNNKTKQALAELNFTAFDGSYTQMPWPYMSTAHPDRAMNYRGIAHIAAGPLQLGDVSELPNISVEATGVISWASISAPDADPKDIINDFLTNPYYGAGFPSSLIGDWTTYSDYCQGTGMLMSAAFTERRSANQTLMELVRATNSEFRWSNGKLDIIPYGDEAAGSYAPPSAPQYSLGKDDLVPLAGGNTPGASCYVQVSRKDPSKRYNQIQIKFMNRVAEYNQDTVTASNEASVALTGLRQRDPEDFTFFATTDAAQQSASLMLGREEIANIFHFTMRRRFVRLDPMDIIALTDEVLGLDEQWVRILEITENEDGTFNTVAEEYLQGTGAAPIYGSTPGEGAIPNLNVDPGDANPPGLFDIPVQIAGALSLQTLIATSGGPNWGGCEVYISADNVAYGYQGRIIGPARMGVLSATFPSGSDPDTTNTLAVNLTQSAAALDGGTQADADNANTLCWVDGEYVSYQQATLTGPYLYNLGKSGATPGYLRRGWYGSAISSHASGSGFVRLDDTVMRIPFDPTRIGQTLYVKLQSFNIYGGGLQDLSSVIAYTHTIGGPPTFYAPYNLTVAPTIKGNQLKWVNALNVGQTAVEIWRSATSSFGGAALIDSVAAYGTAYLDMNVAPATTYYYWIRAVDMAGNPGPFYPSTGTSGISGTTLRVQTADIEDAAVTGPKLADGSVDALKLAAGLKPIQVVSSLPATGAEGDVVFLTTDGQLYRRHGGVWTVAVPTVNLTGTITGPQIAAGAIDTAKVAAGLQFVRVVTSLPGSAPLGDVVFLTTDQKLYRGNGSSWTVATDGGDIVSNSITGGKIQAATITGALIAGGTITGANIQALSISSGLLAANAVTAGKIDVNAVTAGTIAVGAINAAAIIVDDLIVTGKLVANAVSDTSVSIGGTTPITASPSGTPWTTLCSVTKTLGGTGSVFMSFTSYMTWSSSGPRGFYQIVDNSGNVHMTTGYGGGSCPDFITSAGSGLDSTGQTGSVTYYLQANWTAGFNQPSANIPALVVMELKK